MPTSLQQIIDAAEALWPTALAEEWDNPGLAVGDRAADVTHVHLALDVTAETLAEARTAGAQMLFTHHPSLFRPVRTLDAASAGGLLFAAARDGIALFSAHTNADSAPGGVNAVLADLIGLRDQRPLIAADEEHADAGLGRLGRLPADTTLGEFASNIARVLPSTASQVRVSGDFDRTVSTVSLCSGAGDSLLQLPQVQATDVYVTADLRHHVTLDARAAGLPAVVNLSHWASEWVWLPVAARQLAERLPQVRFTVSHLRTDPWDFAIAQ
ncbi:Nif3-like dinuclear metal center hexameric protein [Pseudoclavibacter sp. 13-3]|uniref:Nif3-like dinuclear metal center hexameric protein n=1 Tax=Pseudoclavibacter sp. 13-3 TaxID=2901228 RepID=UPI001E59F5C8|nr:Nif3-like dinuclear metal center hexameric protein [Pseudoclavibacter sp. 13-3]MCD7100512.1 Nif3-like dinuclear metal center hexameric protein [Pseudoclavibacter sp. 13-3]